MEKGMSVRVPLALFCPANVPEGRMKVTCVRELVVFFSIPTELWVVAFLPFCHHIKKWNGIGELCESIWTNGSAQVVFPCFSSKLSLKVNSS